MDSILSLNNIISDVSNYETVNQFGDKHLRNIKGGIQLNDAMFYKFMYAKKDTTKEFIVSKINEYNREHNINDTNFTRKAYENKENNIPIECYSSCKK